VILIFHLHDRLAVDALANIIDGAFALDDVDAKSGDSLLRPGRFPKQVEQD
jgi:hypothetical protein